MLATLRRHVENDVPSAILQLGHIYRVGQYVPQNMKKAAKIYKRAAELGDVNAIVCLGSLLRTGDGIKQDPNKAMHLYRMAADKGDANGQYNLADEMRRRDPLNIQEYTHYYRLAANQGLTVAEVAMGANAEYEISRGIQSGVEEARRWYGRAAAKGHKGAIARLANHANGKDTFGSVEGLR